MQNFFNATELQRNPSTVFNNVQKLGMVTIAPRGRDSMKLATDQKLTEIYQEGFKAGKEAALKAIKSKDKE